MLYNDVINTSDITLTIEPSLTENGVTRIAIIKYKPSSPLNKAFKALEMVTVTLFSHVGKKMEKVHLRRPMIIKYNEIVANSTCAYYDIKRMEWSMEGCQLDIQKKGTK